ncbi:MAG TPA: response regulator, partial [Oleiagrimonas sp.]|nr:response regulator [Oleiagrimonas sp.]
AHGEMDRNLLERMKAPFEHMLRNALAHGIESPEERQRVGKPEEGSVSIHVSRDATEVVIRVSDDGSGMDRDAIRAKAIDRGLLREDVELSDSDLFGFVLESGFSTAGEVTQLAGRGVGMDVVANEIKQLGGTLRIESERGKGTTFVLRLPFTLAVTQAVLVKVGEATFAIPMTSVQGVARIRPGEHSRQLATPGSSFVYAGEEYTIHDMAGLLNVPAGHLAEDQQQPLLLARSGDLRAAVRIDAVLGSREIVVKPVGPQVSSVPGIFGATIMGDGSVLLILDLAPLVRHGMARAEHVAAATATEAPAAAVPQAPERHVSTEQLAVMVVDDSITMRKVTGRILERHEFEVMTAKDGMDALEKLQERVPDLMLLDIEMPRMDGYELATHMKNDSRLKDVPIIMITSRTGEKHRQRALDIGVDRYVGKPYQEADLVEQINQLLGGGNG